MNPVSLTAVPGHKRLAEGISRMLGIPQTPCRVETFPDGELHVRVDHFPPDGDIYILHAARPHMENGFLEVLLIADACRRAGARRVTGILPYFPYARQEKRKVRGEALGARVVCDLLSTRLDRLLTVDLHNPVVEGYADIPLENISAVPLMAEALGPFCGDSCILVAPDLGAVKLARSYGGILNLPIAIIHKERLSGHKVQALRIIGEVKDRVPVLVDDMISTGGTLASAMQLLLESGCRPEFVIAATHGLLVGDAEERLSRFPVLTVILTDSIPRKDGETPLPIKVAGLDRLLADSIRSLYGSDPCASPVWSH